MHHLEQANTSDCNYLLDDNPHLLDRMLQDCLGQPPQYQPGPYWFSATKRAVKDIKKHGIQDFRGCTNTIGLSYSDCLYTDARHTYNYGIRKLISSLTEIFPLNRLYETQLNCTHSFAEETIDYAAEILKLNPRTSSLLENYTIPYSLLGGCMQKANIEGSTYSTHYINLLEQHDNVAKIVDFEKAHSVFEIGGGFGANIHLILENYKNIRKVLYLDIPPNLYVGTQYLKAFYGEHVKDYCELKQQNAIHFSEGDELEILCIAPWQVEVFKDSIDIFMNAHSFVEMPKSVVSNYVNIFSQLPRSAEASIALTSYDLFDPQTTFNPSELPGFFSQHKFKNFEVPKILPSSRKNYYYVCPGRLAK